MSKEAVFKRNPRLISADMAGETVMMDTAEGKYYSLGVSGGYIWSLLETPRGLSDIISDLIETYDVTFEQCLKDTKPFMDDLLQRGIIQTEDCR